MNGHYNAADVYAALERLPIRRGDVVFIHSNLGFFGRAESVGNSDQLCAIFAEAILSRIGESGTLVVPTFTYSFPRRQVFDPVKSSAVSMGVFAEWIRRHPAARRSVDPCFSVAAVGREACDLTIDAPENSFVRSGFFGRLLDRDGVILNLNFDAGSTFLHFIERERGVTYRFDKTFEGFVATDTGLKIARNTIFVRYLSSGLTEAAFEPFHAIAKSEGVFLETNLGRGVVGMIRTQECVRILDSYLPSRPWLLTRAHEIGVMPSLNAEPTWQGL